MHEPDFFMMARSQLSQQMDDATRFYLQAKKTLNQREKERYIRSCVERLEHVESLAGDLRKLTKDVCELD